MTRREEKILIRLACVLLDFVRERTQRRETGAAIARALAALEQLRS